VETLIVLACVVSIPVYVAVIGAQGGAVHVVLLWLPLVTLAVWVVARAGTRQRG
jgi:hypothetical protein